MNRLIRIQTDAAFIEGIIPVADTQCFPGSHHAGVLQVVPEAVVLLPLVPQGGSVGALVPPFISLPDPAFVLKSAEDELLHSVREDILRF